MSSTAAAPATPAHIRLQGVMDHLSPTIPHLSTTIAPSLLSSSAPPSSSVKLADGLVLRRLQRSDYSKGFLTSLQQLTDVGDVSEERFAVRFDEIARRGDSQQVWVIEDVERGVVVASATLLLELKFIHNLAQIGHIEDVVVSGAYRGKNLGYKLIEQLLAVARSAGCYKVILDCDDHNVAFYSKLGFKQHANHLANYFAEVARKGSGEGG